MTAPRRAFTSAMVVPMAAALVLFVFGLYPLANVLAGGDEVAWYVQARTFWIVIGGALILVLAIAARWGPHQIDSMWTTASSAVMRIPSPLFVGAAACFAVVASAVIAVVCFGRQPHNADEVAQLFHAKILLSGRLSLPPDANPEFFGMDNMIEHGRWYSQFPIGGPALLAIGLLLRAAWLVNPVLIGLTVVSLYGFARRAYDEPTARASALLLALCPFALFVAASFMNHVPVLWLATVSLSQLAVWVDSPSSRVANRAALLMGLALGAAFTIRPLDAVIGAGLIGVMQLSHLRGAVWRARSFGVQVAAGLIPVALLCWVNVRTNGAPFRFGYDVLYGSAHSLGFHADPYGALHTPLRALIFASKYLIQLNVLLFEWPLPAVGVIVAGLLAMRQPRKWDFFLLELFLLQVLVYALYWHDGSFRGPRFLFTALPAIILLVARAPFVIAGATTGVARRVATIIIPVCVLIAWSAFPMTISVPGQVRAYRRGPAVSRVDPDALVRAHGLTNALVFINEGTQTRNIHMLWSLGVSRGDAARLMVTASSCAIRQSLEAEFALRPPTTAGRRDRLIRTALAFDAAKTPWPVACIEDGMRDDSGVASYAPFFPANSIDTAGHIGGDVVYALDLDEHNEALRQRFGNRRWYRFGPRVNPKVRGTELIPY